MPIARPTIPITMLPLVSSHPKGVLLLYWKSLQLEHRYSVSVELLLLILNLRIPSHISQYLSMLLASFLYYNSRHGGYFKNTS